MSQPSPDVNGSELATLRETVAALQRRVRRLEAVDEVRKLQHKYGYYLDKCLYAEVVDLFAEESQVKFAGGVYKGKAGVERLYIQRFRENFTAGHNGPVPGLLLEHAIMQDAVTISEDGLSAQGRFRCLMQAGRHASVTVTGNRSFFDQWWEGGLYENEYVVENGVWKIKTLGYFAFWHADFTKGWAHTEPLNAILPTKTYPEDPLGPDELIEGYAFFPVTDTLPFHYPHPVTGEPAG